MSNIHEFIYSNFPIGINPIPFHMRIIQQRQIMMWFLPRISSTIDDRIEYWYISRLFYKNILTDTCIFTAQSNGCFTPKCITLIGFDVKTKLLFHQTTCTGLYALNPIIRYADLQLQISLYLKVQLIAFSLHFIFLLCHDNGPFVSLVNPYSVCYRTIPFTDKYNLSRPRIITLVRRYREIVCIG